MKKPLSKPTTPKQLAASLPSGEIARRHVTLRQLEIFEAVARLGSFTRAAQALHLTQPSVSMQVRSLEEKIGLPLTEQFGRSLHLTQAGEVVAAASRDILGRLGEMQAAIEDMHREVAGPLSIAVVSTAKYFLPQLLGDFKRRFPRVEPRLQELLATVEKDEE